MQNLARFSSQFYTTAVYLRKSPGVQAVNKSLAALTTTALFALGAIAPVRALPIFGTEDSHELSDILDETVSTTDQQESILQGIVFDLSFGSGMMVDRTTLLENPDLVGGIYEGDSVDPNSPPTGFDVYEKDGCYVEAGCAIKAIGLVNALKCAGSGTDPEAWAYCIQDKDYDAYMAATQCTWGSCPGFASVPGEGLYACSQPGETGVFSAFSTPNRSSLASQVY